MSTMLAAPLPEEGPCAQQSLEMETDPAVRHSGLPGDGPERMGRAAEQMERTIILV